MNKAVLYAALAGALVLAAQDMIIHLPEGQLTAMAIPDLRGDAQAQPFMSACNQTLWDDVQGSGRFRMVPKTMYPKANPQQASDWRQPPAPAAQQAPRRGAAAPAQQNGGGYWMSDWSSPPVSADYMAFGYTAVQNGVLVLYGWMYDLGRGAQVIGSRYIAGSVDEAGARQVAHQFAADIIAKFGGQSLFGTHIYFTSNRTGHDEIWQMDPDGGNQKQITNFKSISLFPAVSPDGSKIAFTSYAHGDPGIFVFSVDPIRDLRFYNQRAEVNASPSFTPDGKQILWMSKIGGTSYRIFIANVDGSNLRPISSAGSIDTEPKVNPKTGNEIVFVSGRSGPQQIYRMNMDGTDMQRLTPGEGQASNPSWNPDGQIIAYAWTRGFAPGKFNIFVMDVAKPREYKQLTHDEGKNENPSWAPDGVHLAFASTRSGKYQIWTMLADGTQARQLTTQGSNETPVWGR